MSAGRTSALVVLAVSLAACARRGPEARPWAIEASADGFELHQLVDGLTGVEVRGDGARVDDGTYRISGAVRTEVDPPVALGDVVLRFDARRGIAFPALTGRVAASLILDPAHRGPTLEPRPVIGFILWDERGEFSRPVFWLYETSTVPAGSRVPLVLNALEAGLAPGIEVAEQWIEYDPDECGLVYYDDLVAYGTDITVLRRERTRTVETVADDPATEADETVRWTVAHETSWHRDGACSDQAEAWTQFAAWEAAN